MSKLIKPYEISVWDDVWDETEGRFVEKYCATIGSDTMTSQNRVLEPNLVRNANGTKKLTFKLCKKYKDNKTGLDTTNPFADFLVNERKVKLKYKEEWYDFIVKNVVEDSSKYIYTYQLEDALVTELSKNGFGVILDTEKQNNVGNIKTLAEEVLKDTDWLVESELLVQTIEESLVYVKVPAGTELIPIIDPQDNFSGTQVWNKWVLEEEITALAFYSSCRNTPYRFQLIYLNPITFNNYDKNLVTTDKNQVIQIANCQYYTDIPSQEQYQPADTRYGLKLPLGWSVYEKGNGGLDDKTDSTISSWYRGARYVQGQETRFVPELQRYVNLYIGAQDKQEYYGYVDAEFVSPELILNLISNCDFKGTDGWVGTRTGEGAEKAQVSNVMGYFNGGTFVSQLDELGTEAFEPSKYQAYMHLHYPNENSLVINSGPHDNRFSIEDLQIGTELCLVATYRTRDNSRLNFSLKETLYQVASDCYADKDNPKIAFDSNMISHIDKTNQGDAWKTFTTSQIFTINKNLYEDKKDYKNNSQLRLVINGEAEDYYISDIQLFRLVRDDDGNIIKPDEQGNNIKQINCIYYKYYYFLPAALNNLTNPEDFINAELYNSAQNDLYKPKLIENSEKIGTVSAKESNYFNILQSIAEAFEAWLVLEVERDPAGGIVKKKVTFKKELGKTNYANFRYGVNLKDIKRTYESKQIVTKLIVKNNSNEFGQNGFCTIVRANSNPLGENYIYDFRYYFNQEMLSPQSYLNTLYSYDCTNSLGEKVQAYGLDIPNSPKDDEGKTITNIYGYYPRLRKLNDAIEELNQKLIGAYLALTNLQAEYEIARATKQSSSQSLEETLFNFQQLTGKQSFKDLDEVQKAQDSVIKYKEEYSNYLIAYNKACADYDRLESSVADARKAISTMEETLANKLEAKRELNKEFYSQYSRFIQEGTWIDEKYVDDEKYYTDALSVAYNSCLPKVVYAINVMALSGLPGYELFEFNLGDKTYVEDPDFFGSDYKEEVVITEVSEFLDQPEKDSIKVQNFKNQFQDLFQKITATVQQTQYNTGSYEKAVALAEASSVRKQAFLNDALSEASTMLSVAGQQSVTQGADGITITDLSTPSNSIRLIGGAILLSKLNKNGVQEWTSAITSNGVSASLITAGLVNTKEIQIMNYDKPTFRWDSAGISAFQLDNFSGEVSKVNFGKFVRFDQHGIYGIDNTDGTSWVAQSVADIEEKGKFALTWEGLLVKNEGTIARIGKNNNKIISVVRTDNGQEKDSFYVDYKGQAFFDGSINVGNVFTVNNNGTVLITQGSINLGKTEGNQYNFSVDNNGEVAILKGSIRLGYNNSTKEYNFTATDQGKVAIKHGSILLGYNEGNYNFVATDDGELSVGYLGNSYNFEVLTNGTVNVAKNLNIGKYTNTENGNTGYYFRVNEDGEVTIKGTIDATNGTLGQLTVIGQLKVGESEDGAAYYIGGTEGDSYLNLPNMTLSKDGLLTAKNIRAEGGDLLDLNIRGLLKFPALGGGYYINGVSAEDAEKREGDFKVTHASLISLPGFAILNPLYWSGDADMRVYLKGSVCFQVSETGQTGALYLRNINNFNCLVSNSGWTGSFTDAPDGKSCSALSLAESTGVLTFRSTSQVGYFNSGGAHFKTSNQYLYYASDGIYIYDPKNTNSPVGEITLTPSVIKLHNKNLSIEISSSDIILNNNNTSSIQISSSGIILTNISTMSGGVWDMFVEKVGKLEGRADALEGRADALDRSITALSNRITALESKNSKS